MSSKRLIRGWTMLLVAAAAITGRDLVQGTATLVITPNRDTYEVLHGSKVEIRCKLSQSLQRPINWKIDGISYYPNSGFPSGHELTFSNTTVSLLKIEHFTTEFSGYTYRCFVQASPTETIESRLLTVTTTVPTTTVPTSAHSSTVNSPSSSQGLYIGPVTTSTYMGGRESTTSVLPTVTGTPQGTERISSSIITRSSLLLAFCSILVVVLLHNTTQNL